MQQRTTLPHMNATATFGREPYTVASFEQANLDEDVKLIFKDFGPTLRVAYDPAQINALDARLALNIFANFTEGEQIDGLRELGRDATDTASRDLYTVVLDAIDRAGDASGVIARVVELFDQARTEQLAPCPRYSWCIETGGHIEHTSNSIEPTFLETDRRELLAIGLTHWGKDVRVGFLDQDLIPADARAKVAQLRAYLDDVEQLIDTAEASK